MSDSNPLPQKIAQRELDFWIELLRSMCMFAAITHLLGNISTAILIVTNTNICYELLTVEEAAGDAMQSIPSGMVLVLASFLLNKIITALLGLYGFARLNRYLINYYGIAILISAVWVLLLMLIIYVSDDKNRTLIQQYKEYAKSRSAAKPVDFQQTHLECCGSSVYNFDDLPELPSSCCPNEPNQTSACTREKAYKQWCETKKRTVLESLYINNVLPLCYKYCLPFYTIACVGQAISCFIMVYRINLLLCDDADMLYRF